MKRILVLQPALKLWLASTALAATIAALCAGPVWALTFAHITDIHVDKEYKKDPQGKNFAKMMNALRAKSPALDFVIASGDLVDHGMYGDNVAGMNDLTIDDANWNYLKTYMYKPTSGNTNTWYAKRTGTLPTYTYSIPIYFTPGNHDSRGMSAEIYESQALPSLGSMEGYDTNIPLVPNGATAGSSIAANGAYRDYYIIVKDTALVISLYTGKDWSSLTTYRGAFSNPESEGLDTAQLRFLSQTLEKNMNATLPNHMGKKFVPIIFMHSPAVNKYGWDFKGNPMQNSGETEIQGLDDGCIYNNRREFMDTLNKYKVTINGNVCYPTVFQGHIEQNVILDSVGNYQAENWTGGVRYVQTAGCFDGAYRLITIDANKKLTVGAPQLVDGVYPTIDVTSLNELSYVFAGNTYMVKASVHDFHGTIKCEFYVDGVLQYTTTNAPYTYNWLASNNGKAIDAKITVKAYGAGGAADTNSTTLVINRSQGADSYYNRMNVGDAVYIKDPLSGNTLPCNLVNVDVSGGIRYAAVSINGDVRTVNAGEMQQVPNTGLFIYAATVFTGDVGYRFAELMIAPYQYPSIDIVLPMPGISTNSNIVQVAVNYSGKNIPWNGVGSPPVSTYNMKTITYGSSSTVNESYVWTLSGTNGPRTLTVSLSDKFSSATTVSKSVTVNYDASKPFWDFRGPLGDTWKSRTLSVTNCSCDNGCDACIWFNFWTGSDPGGTHWGGSCMASSRDAVVSRIADYIITGALSQGVPGGATTVYVVDTTEYRHGTIGAGPFGTATFQEIYDKVAFMLGKDLTGNYRVWYGTKSDHSDAIPIPALHLPVPKAPTYSNIQKTSVQINWENLEGEAGYKIERSPNNAVPWTTIATLGTDITNYTDATLTAGNSYWYRVIGVAYSPCTNQTGLSSQVTSMSLSGIINGDFEGSGGWPAPYNSFDWTGCGALFEIANGGPYGKYGRTYINSGMAGHGASSDISQTFTVPADALIFQFRKDGGSATLNGTAITPDINSWGLTTVDISSKRGQSVTFNMHIGFGNTGGGVWAQSKFDCFTIIGTPPTVAITGPANGAAINANTPTTITATATDLAGINRVEFFANDVYIGQSTTSPYTCTWIPASAKTYTLRAVAYDNCGNSSVATGYNGIVNGDFEGTGGWPAPYDAPRYGTWDYGGTRFEILAGGPYGKYGHTYCYNGMQGAAISNNIWQTFMVPLDATTLQFRKDGGYATLNSVAITPDVNGWGLSTFDLTPYRGQSVTFNIQTAVSGAAGGLSAQSSFDCFVVNRSIATDLSTVTVTATGEVAYYKLDASSGTVATDNSGNDNQGTVNGATWTMGQVGNCLSFDGVDDYISYSYSAGKPSNNFTLSAWVKTSATYEIDGESNSGYGGCSGQKWVFAPIHEGNNGGIGVSAGTNGISVYEHGNGYLPALAVYNGTVGTNWAHIVVTVSNKTPTIYLNGSLVRTGLTSPRPVSYATTQIGSYAYGAFNGLIDEVRIYNRVLSLSEVQDLHMQSSLAGSWKFDETSGTTAADISGYGNSGTLTYMDPATDWVTGKYGKTLDFDGSNDYVNVGNPASLKITGNQTIAMWIKPHGFTARRNPYNKAYGGEGTITVETNGKVNYYYGTYGGNGSPYQGFTMNKPCTANIWTHLALVRDLNAMKLRWYKNGVKTDSATALYAAAKASSNNVWIGRGYAGYFDGLIDELRVYNNALSAEEITAIFNNTKIGDEQTVETGEYSELEAIKPVSPRATQLLNCAPNPTTGQTAINFQLAKPAQTTIKVYNLMGQVVRNLVNECLRPGYHSVKWDGKSDKGQKVAAGVYLYRMEAGDYTKTNKMTVLR